jgi:nucleotide-binding universal stress UspA family protein
MPVIQNEIGLALDKIVVAIDFTPDSERALVYGSALARRFASRLTLAHVIDLSVATISGTAVVGLPLDEMRHDSAEYMERTLNDLGSQGITAQGKTMESHRPAAAIIDLARIVNADLIVVGTHNRHGLNKLVMGSCSGEIVRSVTCPVLVVGPRVDPKPVDLDFRNIVFASDLKHDAVEKAFVALAFAKDSIAHVKLVHVIEEHQGSIADAFALHARAESTLEKLIPDAAYTWCTPEPAVVFGNVEQQVLRIAKDTQADLIVLGAHPGPRWFNRIWDGVVEQVISEATCPVLTIRTT